MKIETLAELAQLLDLLAAKGVRAFGGLGVDIDLATLASEEPTASPDVGPAEKCPCGHAVWEHQGGLCIVGCDAEKCVEAKG